MLVAMNSFGWPAATPPLASTASWLTIEATIATTGPFRNARARLLQRHLEGWSSTTRVSAMMSFSVSALPSGRSMVMTRSQENFTSSAVSSAAVMELDAFADREGVGEPVGGDAAVLDARDLGGERRHQVRAARAEFEQPLVDLQDNGLAALAGLHLRRIERRRLVVGGVHENPGFCCA